MKILVASLMVAAGSGIFAAMADIITSETRGPVTVLRMAHGKVQALDLDLLEALDAALTDHAQAAGLVLTGSGGAFSAGVDLKRLLAGGDGYADRFLPLLSRVLVRLFGHEGPAVAAINGHAIAGGCVLAAACDHRVLAAGAMVGVPELAVGVPFPVAPLEIMRFALGDARLQDLAYHGRTCRGDAAIAHGLANEVAPPEEVLARATAVAERLAAGPRARFRLTKRQLRRPAIARIARDEPAADPAVLVAWKDPATREAIRRYVAAL